MSKWVSGLRRICFVATISCSCVAFLVAVATVHAQSFNITNLTASSATKASFPNMVVDGKGNTYLAWVDTSKGGIVVSSQFDGTKFNTQSLITTAVLPSFQPQIAVRVVFGSTPNVEVVWASLNPASTPTAQVYDVFASRSDDGGAHFSTPSLVSVTTGPVALFDSPRLAFDSTGTVDVVWGRTGVWISQSTDGKTFGAAIPLIPVATPPNPPIPPPDTGGPRIAVSSAGHIFVVWTDEANKNAQGTYCTPGAPTTATIGGIFWVNETLPGSGPSNLNTRSLSNNDWKGVDAKFPNGFFGCSYDNLNLFVDHVGLVHLLWSDDSPIEDVLSSKTQGTYPAGSPFAGKTQFSFPINLASLPAASPKVAVDSKGSFYVVWSGGPTGGNGVSPGSTNSQGIFFSRADAATPITDTGNSFTTAINIAPSGAIAPAFPQIAVDSSSNVNIAWEQPNGALKGDGTDMFNVFFARSTDRGNTFPTVLQVTTTPSVFCFRDPPPPQGNGTLPTTPDISTCGTVQIGVDASSTPDLVWVSQASGSAIADIDFATATFPTGSISPNSASLSASNALANFTVTVSQTGFPGPITFSCVNADTGKALPSWLSCSFNPQPLNPSQSNTDTLTISRVGTPTASMFISAPSSHNLPANVGPVLGGGVLAAVWLIAAMVILTGGRPRAVSSAFLMRGFLLMTLTVFLAVGLVSCGGGTSTPTTTTTGSGGGSGSGGTGGGSSVTMHVAVLAQSGGSTTNLGTVTITAQ